MGVGTFASRIAANAGPAVDIAAKRVREKIIKLAAHLLEAAEHDIELDQGRAFVRGVPQMGKSFAELASASIGIAGLSLPEAISPGWKRPTTLRPRRRPIATAPTSPRLRSISRPATCAFSTMWWRTIRAG